MFGSLARGHGCATYAYNFFSSNGGQYRGGSASAGTGWCSWASLFTSLDWLLNARRQEAGLMDLHKQQPLPVDPDEIRSIMAFLRVLLGEFSTRSPRFAIRLRLRVPKKERATVLDIIKMMWNALERYEVLPVKPETSSAAAAWRKSRGVPAELEEIEAPARQYPATTAFIRLLNALVKSPETLPDNLGSGHRIPGTAPYVRFVLDDVLLKAELREYADPQDRWHMTEACLCFVESSLDGYDLSVVEGDWGVVRTRPYEMNKLRLSSDWFNIPVWRFVEGLGGRTAARRSPGDHWRREW
ncbi:structural constituent of nuclear pore protein [Ceratobasidium sp. AG-Ba]|nr:structural constituent of nuclear pore protein [Ceratobasidium sp. AG-Ba]